MKDQEVIIYKDIKELGFKRIDLDDSVHYDQYGYYPFVLEKKLYKNIYAIWYCESRTLSLRRSRKDGTILGDKSIKTLDELKELISFYAN